MKYLIALLACAGLVVSVLALRVHNMDPTAAPPCAVNETWDCGTVNHSRYAVFPARTFDEKPGTFHLPVADLGIAGYALMIVLALAGQRLLLYLAAQAGFCFAAYLTYLEKFVMHKWCIYCVWSQSIVAIILVASIVWLVQARTRRSRIPAPVTA